MNKQEQKPAPEQVPELTPELIPEQKEPAEKPKPKWLVPVIVVVGVVVISLIAWGGYELFKPSPTEDEFADWETYRNEEYGFEVKYPEGWQVRYLSEPLNMTICKGDCFEKDNIQMVEVTYGVNADGSIEDRDSVLKRLKSGEYTKISVVAGEGYYYINETKGGLSPSAYLVGENQIFSIHYTIWSGESISEIENFFKQILSTFKFLEPDETKTNDQDIRKIVAEKMMMNEKIKPYLIYTCRSALEDCTKDLVYQWKTTSNDDKELVAFVSSLADEEWKIDPFNYSTEIYQVDLKTGDVFRLSPAGYDPDYITNIFEE